MGSSLFFIGTGAGGSSGSGRWRASTLVELSDQLILVDCGVGCHYRLSDRGYLQDLDLVFITHMHMDHFLGLPELIFQAHMEGRRRPLMIIGPDGIEEAIRTVGPHLFTNINFQLQIERAIHGRVFSAGSTSLKALEACHVVPSYGLKIEEKDLSIGFSSDTKEPCAGLSELRGVKVLVHEATCDDRNEELCRTYGHSTARQAVEASISLGSELLLLNHIDERFHDVRATEAELLKKVKKPAVRIVNDLERYFIR